MRAVLNITQRALRTVSPISISFWRAAALANPAAATEPSPARATDKAGGNTGNGAINYLVRAISRIPNTESSSLISGAWQRQNFLEQASVPAKSSMRLKEERSGDCSQLVSTLSSRFQTQPAPEPHSTSSSFTAAWTFFFLNRPVTPMLFSLDRFRSCLLYT